MLCGDAVSPPWDSRAAYGSCQHRGRSSSQSGTDCCCCADHQDSAGFALFSNSSIDRLPGRYLYRPVRTGGRADRLLGPWFRYLDCRWVFYKKGETVLVVHPVRKRTRGRSGIFAWQGGGRRRADARQGRQRNHAEIPPGIWFVFWPDVPLRRGDANCCAYF